MRHLMTIGLILFTFGHAQAFLINFDPQSYTGVYQIVGVPGKLSGVQNINLTAGSHLLFIAGNTAISLNVDGSGNVTSNNSAAVNTGALAVSFNTNAFTIDPGVSFTGQYSLFRVDSAWQSGATVYDLVPNIMYMITIGLGDSVLFTLDSSGDVVSSTNDDAVNYSGNILGFNLVDVYVNPKSFAGEWSVGRITPGRYKGLQKVSFIKNFNHKFYVGAFGLFDMFMGTGVSPISVSNPNAADFAENTITFKNGWINIAPQPGADDWFIFWVTSIFSTPLDVVMVPGLDYYLSNGAGNTVFAVDTNFDDSTETIFTPNGNYVLTQKSTAVADIVFPKLTLTDFNPTHLTVSLKLSSGSISNTLTDFKVKKDGVVVSLAAGDLYDDNLLIHDLLTPGVNDLTFEAKDELGNEYINTGRYWAGEGQLIVKTTAASTIDLTISEVVNGEIYALEVSKDTVGNEAVFNFVPQTEVTISTLVTPRQRITKKVRVQGKTVVELY